MLLYLILIGLVVYFIFYLKPEDRPAFFIALLLALISFPLLGFGIFQFIIYFFPPNEVQLNGKIDYYEALGQGIVSVVLGAIFSLVLFFIYLRFLKLYFRKRRT